MSMDDIDMAAIDKHVQKYAKKKRPGWFRRNWRWAVPLDLLITVVVAAGILYWVFFVRVYNLEVCQRAMQTIGDDKGLQESLGEPIRPIRRPPSFFSKAGWQEIMPNARVEESEIDVLWNIAGPKGQALAHLLAKKRSGEWQTVVLEVTPAGSKKVSLHEVGNPADDAPVFQGSNGDSSKPATKKPETKSSDLHIDMPIPPADGPPETK